MTIWEYIAQPEHPWFNTEAYTPLQIGMFTTGALLWVIVYINTIINIVKFKELDIPYHAVTLNFGCEVTTAFFFVPNMGLALVIAYWAWMVLDLFIVTGLFRYAYKQVTMSFLRNNIQKFLFIWLPITFIIQRYFIVNYDLPMAPIDSYIINLVMSACFVYMLAVPQQSARQRVIGWTKFLGTGIISIMFYMVYPANQMLTGLYIACALVDILYLYLLYNPKLVNA